MLPKRYGDPIVGLWFAPHKPVLFPREVKDLELEGRAYWDATTGEWIIDGVIYAYDEEG